MTIANQLIFTRVEPAFSPRRIGGYQIAYKSAGIAEHELEEIKDMVASFPGVQESTQASRWQYFSLRSGNYIVAKTHVIESDSELVDLMMRSGAFLTHCYHISPDEFASVDNNPFALLDNCPFVTNISEFRAFIEQNGKGSGEAATVKFDLPNISLPSHEWPESEIPKLMKLSCGAQGLMKLQKTLWLTGSQPEILNCLRLAIYSLFA